MSYEEPAVTPWPAIIFLGSFALYLFYGIHPLWYEEAMYAETAREMLESGDFLNPTLNYAPFIFKPPLYLWANAASLWAFGRLGEAAVRLPSAAFASGAVVFAYLLGARISHRAGVFSGVALATFYGFVFHTSTMLTDIPLTLLVAASAYFFLRAADGLPGGPAGVYACLALAVMTKGLVGLVFPGIAFVLFMAAGGRRDLLKRFGSPGGILLFVLITVPWHLAMEARHPVFLKNYIMNEQVMRFFNERFPPDTDSVGTPLFILVTFGWLMPWSAFVLQALWRGVREKGPGYDTIRLCLYWALGGMAFLGLSSSKMEYYSLPLFPAFAVLVGSWWAGRGGPEGGGRDYGAGAAGLAAASLGGVLAFKYFSPVLLGGLEAGHVDVAEVSRIALGVFSSLFAASLAALALAAGRRYTLAFWAVAVGALLMCVQARAGLDAVAFMFSDADTARAVSKAAGKDDVLVVDGAQEYEFCATYCYYGRRKVYILDNHGKPVLSVKFSEAERFVITAGEFRRLWGSPRRVFLVTRRSPGETGIAGKYRVVYEGSSMVYTN